MKTTLYLTKDYFLQFFNWFKGQLKALVPLAFNGLGIYLDTQAILEYEGEAPERDYHY